MNRAELLATVGLIAGGSASNTSQPAGNAEACGAEFANFFRYVIPVGPYRVGLLSTVGTVLIGEQGSSRISRVNLPRPTRGTEGWHPASAPAAPYANPEVRISDVVMDAGPDKVTAAGTVGPYAVFSMAPPPDKFPRSYLVRVAPSTLELQAMWFPSGFDGFAIALFIKSGKLGVIDLSGNPVQLDYP